MTLVSRWLLDESSGTKATDSVGENHGTYEGAPLLGENSIIPAYPLSHSVALREAGHYIEIPDSPSLRFTSAFTLALWYEWDGSDNGFLLDKGSEDYALFLNADGSLTALLRYEASKWRELSTAAGAVPKDEPARLHVLYDKAHLRILVDGIEVASEAFTDTVLTSTNGLAIGRQQSAETAFLHGRYQKVEVSNAAITVEEAKAEFDAENFKEPAPWEDFNGDYETGDFSQYLETQAPPGRARIVSSPVGEGNFAACFEFQEGDPIVAGGHRSEAIPDREFRSGDAYYFRDLIFLDLVDWNHWTIPLQFHDTSKGSPPLCGLLRLVEDEKRLLICKGDQSEVYFDLPVPVEKDFFEVVVLVNFGELGSIELWIDGEFVGEVIEVDTIGIEPTNFKEGLYRASDSEGTTRIYHDGLRITKDFFSDPPAPRRGGIKAVTVSIGGVPMLCPIREGM
jgi:hypothetical protein